MITSDYCRQMARYNMWQNDQIHRALQDLTVDQLTQDRGVFFGSILGTVNHLLWGDLTWMSRLDGGPGPGDPVQGGTVLTADGAAWWAARQDADARIRDWATGLSDGDLQGSLHWYSSMLQQSYARPRAECVLHMFNHQTHHRGQVHAMITGLGRSAPVSDLVLMPPP